MTVEEIVIESMKQRGVTALCNTDCQCGCAIDDICPVEGPFPSCQDAKRSELNDCVDCEAREGCDFYPHGCFKPVKI